MKQLFLALCLTPSMAMAQLTLEECYEKARANYPLIKQHDLITKSAEYSVSNAGKGFLPQISVTGVGAYIISGLPATSLPGVEPPEDSKIKFLGLAQLNQPIWDGGATKTQKSITQASAEVEKASIEVSLHAISERVSQLFFGVLLIDQQMKNLDIVYETLNRNFNRLKLSQENGLAFQTDVDEVRAEILNVDERKIEFEFARRGYVEMLSFMIGQPLPESVELKKPEVIESVAELQNHRPELNLFASQTKLFESQFAMDKVANMPKVGLMGAAVVIAPGASFGASTLSSVAFAGLAVSWSTSNVYKSSNNRELNRIQLARVANQREVFAFNNNLEQKKTNIEIEKQKAILQKDDEIVALKASVKKSYQLKYDNGLSSMNDLINSITKENEALSNRSLHEVQLLMSIYNFKNIMGN